ncbi:MAG: hypothetical protein H0U49_04675 [Parachlamydiaceae bacterium]|nr:hypothetical protein [Parachlamydiaceae bacterium]
MLNPHELALFDQYVEEMPRHTLEQSYDLQLKMSGSKMKPESPDLIKKTLVEEVLELMPDYGKPDSISMTNPQKAFESQTVVIDRARENLRTKMDGDQFAFANQFFNQQEAQLKMAEQMFHQE